MKRYGNLWHLITEFENLWLAAKKAQKGKRFKENVLKFNLNLESELLTLHKELLEQTYSPGQYHSFEITEPKTRLISAAPYRDRVVHHALCNVISPILEKSLIPDTYANRVGFGTHKALKRFTEFLRSSRYILQCDIRKYFPSIDHDILNLRFGSSIKLLMVAILKKLSRSIFPTIIYSLLLTEKWDYPLAI
jgi:retron-type reverse transcriptase